jgi:hypothetical protein
MELTEIEKYVEGSVAAYFKLLIQEFFLRKTMKTLAHL